MSKCVLVHYHDGSLWFLEQVGSEIEMKKVLVRLCWLTMNILRLRKTNYRIENIDVDQEMWCEFYSHVMPASKEKFTVFAQLYLITHALTREVALPAVTSGDTGP